MNLLNQLNDFKSLLAVILNPPSQVFKSHPSFSQNSSNFIPIFQKGDRGTIVELLAPNEQQPEAGYLLEMFANNETLDVIAAPVSWTSPANYHATSSQIHL